MRHKLKSRKLGRTASHRKATLRSLSIALLTHHRIVTTLPKAKELRRHIEPILTRSKEDSTHNRRIAFSYLQDNKTVTKLFEEIGPLVAERPGGYTRVVRLGARSGDSAEMAVIELVDYNETESEATSKKRKRTRRSGSGKTTPVVAVDEEVAAEKVASSGVTEEDVSFEDDGVESVQADAVADQVTNSETTEESVSDVAEAESADGLLAEPESESVSEGGHGSADSEVESDTDSEDDKKS